MKKLTGLIFDLDGVLVDTAKYHYIAWKEIADYLGIVFTEQENESLKGVSRSRSLEIVLELGNVIKNDIEKERLCEEKNQIYIKYINKLRKEELFPGVREFIEDAREQGYLIALGSASKNSRLILERLDISDFFDVIVDGTVVKRTKPDPEVFEKGALGLGVSCENCIVFEDSIAGIEAAHRAGMKAVGVGIKENLPQADLIISGFSEDTKIQRIVADLKALDK